MDIAQIARLVRADIKRAQASGELGEVPAGIKFAVRIERFSMGKSLDIFVLGAPDEWAQTDADETTRREYHVDRVISPACKALAKKLAAILGEYNFDGSDPLTDYSHVRFYATVYLGESRVIG